MIEEGNEINELFITFNGTGDGMPNRNITMTTVNNNENIKNITVHESLCAKLLNLGWSNVEDN